jgi:arginyl-tRNA synthetase
VPARSRGEVFLESIKNATRAALGRLLRDLYGDAPENIVVEYPPQPGLGDLSSPVAFEMARRLRRAPRAIAQELAAAFPPLDGVARVDTAGAGYLNVHLDRGGAVRAMARQMEVAAASGDGEAIIVEHTNINPNKAAHIGHLRNAVLGDSLARALRFLGHRVEVQNYIDDTGVQVADVVIGIREILGYGLDQVRAIDEPLDRFSWNLYARVGEWYAEQPERREMRPRVLKDIEEGNGENAAIASYLARCMAQCHLDTMARIGVRYDLLPWEGDILGLRFWETAFSLLKEKGAIRRLEAGERAGCWVMSLQGDRFEDLKESEKIIVRSNGTVTYVGKDIAYQLWKFGLLDNDFHYTPFRDESGGHTVWSTTRVEGAATHPPFGKAQRVYNVIDVRQSYLQAIVAEGLRALGYSEQAERSVHFAYEMVALTPASAERLGVTLSEEDRGRAYIGMAGRKGFGIKADDLLDTLEAQALREVRTRHADLPPEEATAVAHAIAVGALRYFMVRFSRNKVLAFDFDEALAFEGETGPYLQYSVVRAAGIFDKMAAAGGPDLAEAARLAPQTPFDLPEGEAAEDHWELVTLIARLPETVALAVDNLELSYLAKYAFTLAQRFNSFYHKYPVMKESDRRWKEARTVLTWLFISRMRQALDLMGIPIPSRM